MNTDPDLDYTIHRGDRIAQLVIQRFELVEWEVVEDLGARIVVAQRRMAEERDLLLLEGTGHAGVGAVIGIIAAPEGLERIQRAHPDVAIVVASIDRGLNEKGYIVPGLGDAGDRCFGAMPL